MFLDHIIMLQKEVNHITKDHSKWELLILEICLTMIIYRFIGFTINKYRYNCFFNLLYVYN